MELRDILDNFEKVHNKIIVLSLFSGLLSGVFFKIEACKNDANLTEMAS